MEGRDTVKTDEDWRRTSERAAADLGSGGFLIDRLAAERCLDPTPMATLLVLRRWLIDEQGATTAADRMLVDSAVLSYYLLLRVNGWIGKLAIWLEREFFQQESLGARLKGRYGTDSVRGLHVEEIVSQLVERLVPLLDRSNRMMLCNLKALKERR